MRGKEEKMWKMTKNLRKRRKLLWRLHMCCVRNDSGWPLPRDLDVNMLISRVFHLTNEQM
jgi:hypothetical protein